MMQHCRRYEFLLGGCSTAWVQPLETIGQPKWLMFLFPVSQATVHEVDDRRLYLDATLNLMSSEICSGARPLIAL